MSDDKVSPELLRYLSDFSSPILPKETDDALSALRTETINLNLRAIMMISAPQGKLLNELVYITGARRILEIGTFTGYSAIAMASALPADGKLITLDINPDTQAIAIRYAKSAKLEDKIRFCLGDAADSIEKIGKENEATQFDFIFIDANKDMYCKYFDLIMDNNLLADRGVIVCDNVLRGGRVVEAAGYAEKLPPAEYYQEEGFIYAAEVHRFNSKVVSDCRVQSVLLPIYDGVSILRKI